MCEDTVCNNSMGELHVNSFQQFELGSFSNITTVINQFKNYCIKTT